MNRNFNLPPGCTAAEIDQRFGDDPTLCPECDGEPENTQRTNCCDAPFYAPGWPDIDICKKCGDHAEPITCDHCNGTGHVEPPPAKGCFDAFDL